MIGSAIRQLAGAPGTFWVCAAFNESVVQVWDVAAHQQLGEFNAHFAHGANNLALHPGGCRIVTGISSPGNGIVAAYETPAGRLLWERTRLSYPANLRFSGSGDFVYCTINNRKVEKIDAVTGLTITISNGVRQYFEGSYGYSLTVSTSGAAYRVKDERDSGDAGFSVEKRSFALLDTSFSPDCVYLTESAGPVRCIDLDTRTELWRYDPPPGSHVLNLHWSARDEAVYGVLWHYEKGLFRYLERFDQRNGRAERVCVLDSWEETFVDRNHQLVTSAGDIVDLSNGRVVAKLVFPQIQYPDRFEPL